jgi:hypothetical protein
MITAADIESAFGRDHFSTTLLIEGGVPRCEPPLTAVQQAALERAWPDGDLGAALNDAHLALGHTVAGYTYDLSVPAQNAWANSLVVLREAQSIGAISDSTPVESVIGPVLDRDGAAVPSMTVAQYRVLLLTQLMPRVAQIRGGQF